MLVDVAHEELVAVLLREGVGEVEARSAVRGLVDVVTAGLDVVVDKLVHVLPALLVVDAALDDMKQVRDDAACGDPGPDR